MGHPNKKLTEIVILIVSINANMSWYPLICFRGLCATCLVTGKLGPCNVSDSQPCIDYVGYVWVGFGPVGGARIHGCNRHA